MLQINNTMETQHNSNSNATSTRNNKMKYLIDIQNRSQEYWSEINITHVDASDEKREKFMVRIYFYVIFLF